ncbi:hypothetical protein H0I76_09940 [Limibaculum sp. M0105]|uniref:Uncharacterized protein n=1 Tax=Thermohalobaculum xanthum TaxID=2753746 RepID=A0A8J7SCL9_9RHOB|nr:hypothetical protein [Thermohalobaculum xanthum]MBK0399512.1 hypothetical protein [Thermohalobaculum xanthum]
MLWKSISPLAFIFVMIGTAGFAVAGTATCTAGEGVVIDGGECCKALTEKYEGCTCDESDLSVNGKVTCSGDLVADGGDVVINAAIGRILNSLSILDGRRDRLPAAEMTAKKQ